MTRSQRNITISLAVTTYYNALQACTSGYCLINLCISLTDGYTLENGLFYTPVPDTFAEEFLNVIGNVVMAPGKYRASFVRRGGERTTEDAC